MRRGSYSASSSSELTLLSEITLWRRLMSPLRLLSSSDSEMMGFLSDLRRLLFMSPESAGENVVDVVESDVDDQIAVGIVCRSWNVAVFCWVVFRCCCLLVVVLVFCCAECSILGTPCCLALPTRDLRGPRRGCRSQSQGSPVSGGVFLLRTGGSRAGPLLGFSAPP